MKKLALILVAVIQMPLHLNSQCKNKTDAMTNEKVLTYEDNFRENTLLNSIKFENKQTEYKLDFSLYYMGGSNSIMPAGTEVLVKLKSGDIIKLKTSVESNPKVAANAYGVYTQYSYVFLLPKEDVQKLSTGCELVRFPDLKGGNLDLKKAAGTLTKGAKCMLDL